HHHLMRAGTRVRVGIIVETGEAREVHHFCLLTGYGAGAVNPYLAFETIEDLVHSGAVPGLQDVEVAKQKYIKAITKGLLKVMSKMGISTLQSYHGAQIFEAIGLSNDVIERYFTGTTSRIQGIDLSVIAEEARMRHASAYPSTAVPATLDVGGEYHFRAQGERHLWNPSVIAHMQRAVSQEDINSYREYARLINEQPGGPITLRSLFQLVPAERPVPLDEVESAASIVR